MSDVPLSRLTHDVIQNTYKDMHALLDSLGDLAPEARRAKLLDFLLKMRHRFARLLVAVRWFMSYSAFHGSAQATRQLASTRSTALMQNADTLHAISGYVRNASASPSAVQEAAEILGASAFFARIPRMIESSVGLDLSQDKNELDESNSDSGEPESRVNSEAIERLGVVTRYVVTNFLPKAVQVIDTNVGPENAAIRIGVRKAWTADLILDSLKPEEALLRLAHYEILIDAHPDAPGDMYTRWRSKEAPVSLRESREPLHEMIQDRMKWTADEARSAKDQANLQKRVLLKLCKMMTFECAGKLAMEHMRSQSTALIVSSTWKSAGLTLSGVGSQAADDVPVRIRYWQRSHVKGSLSVKMASENDFDNWDGNVLQVQHEGDPISRDLPSCLELNSINAEGLLVSTCKMRASLELQRLKRICAPAVGRHVEMRIITKGCSSSSLQVSFNGHRNCLIFWLSLLSGGLCVRAEGIASFAHFAPDSSARDVRTSLWEGAKFFPQGLDAVKKTIVSLFSKVQAFIHSYELEMTACAIGVGASPVWPPGRAHVEKPEKATGGARVTPPFMPVDKKRPRRFLTMTSVASDDDPVLVPTGSTSAKRARSLPLPYTESSDRQLVFIRGRRLPGGNQPSPQHSIHCSASSMADWVTIRNAVKDRFRRDHILRWFEEWELGTPIQGDFALRSSQYTLLNMRLPPLEVEKAALVLREGEGWEVQLTLNEDIFDTDVHSGQVVKYSSPKRLLTFTYPSISAETMKTFKRDCIRARTTAAMLMGLPRESKLYQILRRSPSCVEVRAHEITFTIGTGRTGVQLEAKSHGKLIPRQVVPYMEEVMNESGKDMGVTFCALLELCVPLALALQVSKPSEQALFQVGFISALHARVFIAPQPKKPTYAVDVEVLNGAEGVVLKDLHRYFTMKKSSRANQFRPIPKWKNIIDKLESTTFGKGIHDGAGISIQLGNLRKVMSAIVKGVQMEG